MTSTRRQRGGGTNLPVVLWIHGGGWQTGDKSSVQQKLQALTGCGFIFVSINHRFVTKELFKFLDPLVGVNR